MSKSKGGSESTDKLLTEISGKITLMITKIETLTGAVMDMGNSLKNQGDSVKKTIATNLNQIQQPLPFLLEMNDLQISIEATRQKRSHE